MTVIGDNAFTNNTDITSVTIPEGVTKIGYRAFYGCTNLTDITIPNSVTEIITYDNRYDFWELMDAERIAGRTEPDFAMPFEETPWLENKRKTDPLVVVNNILIDGKKCSGSVTIPNGVTRIAEGAFCEHHSGPIFSLNIENVTIPDSVTKIDGSGRGAFAGCPNISITYKGSTYNNSTLRELFQ